MRVFLFACGVFALDAQSENAPVDYVNTRIGNISHLLVPTFPTTHQPNSMLRMIPGHHDFVTDRMRGLPLNVPSHRRGMFYCLCLIVAIWMFQRGHLIIGIDHEISKPYFTLFFWMITR